MSSTTTRTDAEIEADARAFLSPGGAWADLDVADLLPEDAPHIREEARWTWGYFAEDDGDEDRVEAIIRRVIVEASR